MTRLDGGAMAGTVARGVRSRALLSAGSVLLLALAIGSAVLGPVFQEAVTSSYLVTRLDEAPDRLTGLSWRFQPDRTSTGEPDRAVTAAEAAVRPAQGPFGEPRGLLETRRVAALGGIAMLLAVEGGQSVCAGLEVSGSCPRAAGEVLMLAGDLEGSGHVVGDVVELAEPVGAVTVVGSYRVPADGDQHWFDVERFASTPRRVDDRTGTTTPYQPAPFVTVSQSFASLPTYAWTVRVDRRLEVPPDLTLADLATAQRTARGLAGPAVRVEGGRLRGESLNDLATIVTEVRAQQGTARASIAPAVISLVLVALALLLRLLTAAAVLRLPELALASLRGLSRRRLWVLGLTEPLALLLLAVPAGALVGLGLATGLVRWWLVPGLPISVPAAAVLSGLAVAAAALGVAVAAVGLVLRDSLGDQLTGVRRPRRASRATLVVQLGLTAAAGAVLASKLSAGAPTEPDSTDLVLPVLLAVVAGLAATRLTAALATWWTRRGRTSRALGGFVAARAISRRHEGTLVVLPVTAAIAICVFGAGVHDSAAQWRASVAATAAPAPVVWTSPLPMDQTVRLTHDLDPDGRWLMATTQLNTLGPTLTVADLPRLARVGTWPDQWTPGTSAAEVTRALTLRATVPTLTGARVALRLDRRLETEDELVVRLRLAVPGERVRFAYLGPVRPGASTVAAPTPYCRAGCRLEEITIGGPAGLRARMRGELRFTGVEVDDATFPGAFSGAGWGVAPLASSPGAVTEVHTDGDELVVRIDSRGELVIAQLASGALPRALPVVKGVDAETAPPAGSFTRTTELEVDPVISSQSVPFLGPVGLLVDYTMLTTDRTVPDQGSTVHVLARADTPVEVTRGLQDRGASVAATLAGVQRTLDQGAYALALRLYAVVAALVLLMALAGLLVSTAVQLPARRRDAASLRVVGVPRRVVLSAVLRELVVVLGSTAVAGLAAGTLAQYVVLRTVTLGYVEELRTPALVAAVDWPRLAGLSLLTAGLLGAVALTSAVLTVRGARGATLREDAR